MMNVKVLLTKVLQKLKTHDTSLSQIATPITDSMSSVTMAHTTYTKLAQISLPANGKYLIIMNGGCGAVSSGTYFSLSTYVSSGTASTTWNATQMAPTNAGGQCSGIGYYVTGNAGITVQLRGYLYDSGSTSGAWGTLAAVQIG